jgi:Tol biopolymer transport system component
VSPDGRWLAYESDSSGQGEVFVTKYPDTTGKQWPVSAGGGIQPAWARNGKELFYLALDGSLMTVAVEGISTDWRAGVATKLFQGPYYTRGSVPQRMYDVAPDGQRFLMVKSADSAQAVARSIVIVQTFGNELSARLPAK